jgi:hypothetical protein
MSVGDKILETEIGRSENGKWCWRARGVGVAEFFHAYSYALPGWRGVDPEGWAYVGPFRSKHAARCDCDRFEREYMEALYPDVEVTEAPDPRSLN